MKVNKFLSNTVVGTVATSILAASCTPLTTNIPFASKDAIYKVSSKKDLGDIVVPINIQLSSDEAKLVSFLDKLATDIIKNPKIAQEFSKDPNAYLKKNGFKLDISLDNEMLNLILALGDSDINQAVKKNDIKRFFSLCKEKKLLNLQDDLFKNLTQDDVIKISKKLGLESELLPAPIIPVIFVVFALLVVILLIDQEVDTEGGDNKKFRNVITETNPVLTIWTLKDNESSMPFVVNEYIENQINDIVDLVKKEDRNYFKINSEEYFRNLLRINYLNAYGL